jgi:SAM-dependent methyltransferase
MNRIFALPAALLGLAACVVVWLNHAPAPPAAAPAGDTPVRPAPPPAYTYQAASPDGTGKFFMGREIARVMGHAAIDWLERPEREREEAPSQALGMLDLAPDAVIADIGAGSGYHALRIAPRIPRGRVVAVDIQQEMLDALGNRARELGIPNIELHLGAIDDLQLPPETLDAALLVDAYHEFSHPREMLDSLHAALKPGGRIFLLEFRGEDPRVPIKPLHKMTAAQAQREFEACGFRLVENRRHLPWQHFLVLIKPPVPETPGARQ